MVQYYYMKQSIDFHVVDKAFNDNRLRRLSYLNIFEPSFEDLAVEFSRFVKIYFDNYYTVSDLSEIIYCILCHVIYEFKTTFEADSKVLLETVNQLSVSHLNESHWSIILFDDVINEKCIYYKSVVVLSKEQYSIFVKVLKEARCVYLGLFLKRLLIIRVSGKDSESTTDLADAMAIRELEDSMSRLANQELQVIHRNDDNYSVITVKGTKNVTCANVSAKDWRMVALGLEDGAVVVADVRGQGNTMVGHSMPVMDLGFVRDSDRLLTCSLDETVKIWDPQTSRCLHNYRGHYSAVWSVSPSPTTNNHFVSGGMDGSVCLWDVERDQPVRKMVGHLSSVKVTVFHDCGRYVASGSDDGHVRLWDIRSANCVRLWESKSSGKVIGAIDFNSESSFVSWGTDSGLVESVSLEGAMGQSFNTGEPVTGLVCRRGNGVIVGTAGGSVYVLDNGDQISKIVSDECGRLLGMHGTRELAGPVVLIREHL